MCICVFVCLYLYLYVYVYTYVFVFVFVLVYVYVLCKINNGSKCKRNVKLYGKKYPTTVLISSRWFHDLHYKASERRQMNEKLHT